MQQEIYDRHTLSYSVVQWGLGFTAAGICFVTLWATQNQCRSQALSIRTAAGLGGAVLCLAGNLTRREGDRAAATAEGIAQAMSRNAIGWADLRTLPTRTALRQLESSPNDVSMLPSSLSLFDWAGLADADNHPVIGVIAPMNGGKSRLIRYLGRHVLNTPTVRVFDVYGRIAEWEGCQVFGEYPEMAAQMADDIEAIAQEVREYRAGREAFTGVLTVMEEGADTIRHLKSIKAYKSIALDWLSKNTTVTRKIRRRLAIVSVKLSSADFGVGAESRDTATLIFVGAPGVALAMNDTQMIGLGTRANVELRTALNEAIASFKRPALIYHQGNWHPAQVPELDAAGNPVEQVISAASTAANFLDCEQDFLQRCLEASPEASVLSNEAQALADYLVSRCPINLRQLQQNWKVRGQRFSQQQIYRLLAELEVEGLATIQGEDIKWINT